MCFDTVEAVRTKRQKTSLLIFRDNCNYVQIISNFVEIIRRRPPIATELSRRKMPTSPHMRTYTVSTQLIITDVNVIVIMYF